MRARILIGSILGLVALFMFAVPAQAIPPRQDPYPKIRLIPGTVGVNDDVALAVRAALAQAGTLVPSADYFSISALRSSGDWIFISLVGLNGVGIDLKWNFLDHVNWFGVAFLHRDSAGRWAGAVEGTLEFSQLLVNVPDAILDGAAKQTLDPVHRPARAPLAGYSFPWSSGREMQYGTLGVHAAGFYSGWKAVDFLSDGDTSVNHAPNSLRASESGSISYVCNDGTSVAIQINNLLYVHLINNSNLYTGKTFNQGDEIGQLKTGSFSNTCGYASQQSNWFHVHWGFPDTGSFQAEDWTLSLSDGLWRRNTETRGVGSWFQAGSGSSTNCPYSADQIALYENSNYGGSCKTFSIGDYANPSAMGFANDSASSIRVGSNVKATLCRDDNYAGGCEDFTGDDSDLNGNSIGDNQVSSLRVQARSSGSCEPNADQVGLFVDTNYGGQCVVKGIGDYANPSAIGLPNDAISSVKIGSNVIATLCKNDNFNDCMNFDRTDANIGDDPIGDNQVSSVKVISRSNPPSAPTLSSPSNGTTINEGDAITLAWSATGDQYYGEIWGGPATLTFGWQTGTSNNIGSQWAGYTYSWHVKAKNGSGESGYSDTWTFTVKPRAPSGLTANATSCSQVNLAWADNSGNEEGYKIYRNGAFVNQVGAGTQSYADTSASASTSYAYTVKAYRGAIESDASNTANVTTIACPAPKPDLRPHTPTGYASPVVPSSVQGTTAVGTLYAGARTHFDWHFSNSGSGTATNSFRVEVWVDSQRIVNYPYANFGAGATGGFDDWAETIATPGTHTIRMVVDPDNAIDEADETNNTWQQTFTWQTIAGWKGEYWKNTTLDGNPWLTRDDAAINFDWGSDAPDPALTADSFSARWTRTINFTAGTYRFTIFHDDGARLFVDGGKVFENWCSDCRLTETVDVTLVAGNHTIILETWENSGWAGAKLGWEEIIPASPTNLRATSQTQTSIALAWNDNSSNEGGFKIYRALGTTSTFVYLASVTADKTAYTDSGLGCNRVFSYKVTAYNSEGESGAALVWRLATLECMVASPNSAFLPFIKK